MNSLTPRAVNKENHIKFQKKEPEPKITVQKEDKEDSGEQQDITEEKFNQNSLIVRKSYRSGSGSKRKRTRRSKVRQLRPELLGISNSSSNKSKKKKKKKTHRKSKSTKKMKIKLKNLHKKTNSTQIKPTIPDVLRNPDLDEKTLGNRIHRRKRLTKKNEVRKSMWSFNKAKKEKYKRVMKKMRRIPFHRFTYKPRFVEVDENFPFSKI